MGRIFFILILLITLSSYAGITGAEPRVHYAAGKLTLDVHGIELTEILEVFEKSGVQVHIGEGVNPLITATFSNRPVSDAFNVILKGFDYSLIWRKEGGDGAIRLEEIQVFERGEAPTLHRTHAGGLDVVAGRDHKLMVRDTVMIMLEKGVSKGRIQSFIAQYNGILVNLDEQLGIALIRLPKGSDPEAISEEMIRSGLIKIAEPDYVYELPRSTMPGGIPLPEQDVSEKNTIDSGIRVAVLDSGMAASYRDSPFLAGTYNALSPSLKINEGSGHGTQMALIAAGIVDPIGIKNQSDQTTSVLAVRVFDHNGFTSASTLMNGINYAVDSGARIVSMSWGSDTDSRMLESVVDYASDLGLVLVAAVGNEPTGVPMYPAAYENVIGIGALLPDGQVWPQSNYGSFVDGGFSGLARFSEGEGNTFSMFAGTSISTAFASRKIAEILERKPDADTDQILEALFKKK